MGESNERSPDDSSRPASTARPGKYPGFPDLSLFTRFPKSWLCVISENASDVSSSRNSTENCCGDTAEESPALGPGGMSVRTIAAVTAVTLPSPSWIIWEGFAWQMCGECGKVCSERGGQECARDYHGVAAHGICQSLHLFTRRVGEMGYSEKGGIPESDGLVESSAGGVCSLRSRRI